MTVIVRFAPSPTGHLHVGNLRTALVTWLFARKSKGSFLFRLDDTDTERSKEEYAQSIAEDLKWLGLDWDLFAKQSERVERYNTLIEALKQKGRIYACYETEEELALKRKSLLGRGLPPIYDRAALNLSAEQIAKYEAEGRKPHWRFKLEHKTIAWTDHVRGAVSFEGKDMSDPVVIREDGRPLYHLCSVIDDVDFNITHIVRGEDHVSNTATHIQMFEALDAKPPEFAHLALLSGKDGDKLSKRLGSLSVGSLRDEEGLEPMAINSLLARIGTSESVEAFATIQPLIDSFDFSKFSRGMPKFDTDELMRLNAKILHDMAFSDVQERLKAMNLDQIDENFWTSVRPNLLRLSDIQEWWTVTKGVVTPIIDDADFTAQAADLLPDGAWDNSTWDTWIAIVKQETGRNGKVLFMPLRKALTGMEHGPELKTLLPLLGKEKAAMRLHGKAA